MEVVLILSSLFVNCETGNIVYPVLIEERQSNSDVIQLKLSENVIIPLEKASIFGPSFLYSHVEHNRIIYDALDSAVLSDNLYQNKDHVATFTLQKTQGGVTVEGVINSTHAIRPVSVDARSRTAQPHHIFAIPRKLTTRDEGEVMPDRTFLVEDRNLETRILPNPVVMQVYVLTDYVHTRYFKNDTAAHVRYVCLLMNTVKMRFEQMTLLNLTIKLVGIFEAKREADETFLSLKDGYVFAENTLGTMTTYLTTEAYVLEHVDMMFLLSGRDIARFPEGYALPTILGRAYTGAVCTMYRVGLGEDIPGFYTGGHTTTHEMAHILGASHDSSGNDCSGTGHIMSYKTGITNEHTFSRCSQESMISFLISQGPRCWYEYVMDDLVRNFSQRTIYGLSSTTFCKAQNFASGRISYKTCIISCYCSTCNTTSTPSKQFTAPYGFRCGTGKICLFGKCKVRVGTDGKSKPKVSSKRTTTATTRKTSPNVTVPGSD